MGSEEEEEEEERCPAAGVVVVKRLNLIMFIFSLPPPPTHSSCFFFVPIPAGDVLTGRGEDGDCLKEQQEEEEEESDGGGNLNIIPHSYLDTRGLAGQVCNLPGATLMMPPHPSSPLPPSSSGPQGQAHTPPHPHPALLYHPSADPCSPDGPRCGSRGTLLLWHGSSLRVCVWIFL